MGVLRYADITPEPIGPKRERYLARTERLMMVVIDFADGPTPAPDPPHSHPHEQVSYVVSGEILFFLDGRPEKLGPGDIYTVPPNVPHCIQLLSERVRLVDTFHPIREDFLS